MSDVYIVGADMIAFGRYPDRTYYQLGAEASLKALDDAGVSIKDKLGGEVRFGGAISYLTSASVSAETQPQLPGVVDPGASFGYSVGGDWVYALSAGYKIQW